MQLPSLTGTLAAVLAAAICCSDGLANEVQRPNLELLRRAWKASKLRIPAGNAVVEADEMRQLSVIQKEGEEFFNSIPKNLKPCFQAKNNSACGWRGSEKEFPGGLHCGPKDCCSKTAVINGLWGGVCTSDRIFCSSSLVMDRSRSYGSCNCKKYQNRCPVGSKCFDTEWGAYCYCLAPYVQENGHCVIPKSTTTTTTTTTTVPPFTFEPESRGCEDECKPPKP